MWPLVAISLCFLFYLTTKKNADNLRTSTEQQVAKKKKKMCEFTWVILESELHLHTPAESVDRMEDMLTVPGLRNLKGT